MNNLKQARRRVGLSQIQVGKLVGISQNQYSNWETGKSKIDNDSLKRLSEIFGVSVDYLLNSSSDSYPKTKVARIPVLGTVAAGIPIDAIEEIVDWEEIPEAMAKGGEYFGLRIKGSSMEPRIKDGDTVIVRQQDSVDSGQIAIVLVNGFEATCKKVVLHQNGGLSLIAFNAAAYEAHFYTPDEIQSLPVRIIGRVVELRGKF